MGSFFAKALKKIIGGEEMRLILVGLDFAGKTTMIHKLRVGENIPWNPYPEFIIGAIETLEFKNIKILSWDVGRGSTKIRVLYRHYYTNTKGIIFMVDSNDRQKISDSIFYDNKKIKLLTFGFIKDQLYKNKSSELQWPIELSSIIFEHCKFIPDVFWDGSNAKEELDNLLSEEKLNGVPLLIYANKQDLPNAMTINEITNCLGLNKILQKNRKWHIQELIATSGDGMYEGLDWLSNVIDEKKKAI